MRLATLLGPDLKQTLAEDPAELLEALEEFHAEDIAEVVPDLEDDVALGFRRLRYPVAFSKCALFSVGSSSTWPGLLGALAWLADLVEYIDRAVSSSAPRRPPRCSRR